MSPALDALDQLYSDTKTCAQLVGLSYVEQDESGYTRVKRGKGFSYQDDKARLIADKKLKERITQLVIPPAWEQVWICPSAKGHLLATGIDEKGRKQYIYHPKWRTMRNLIKFYRMISFARALPKIRHEVKNNLSATKLTYDSVMAVMLWILDNAYIRIGNDVYFQENDSVGLTTLTDRNLVIAGAVVTLSFKGKSGKDQQITFEHETVAKLLSKLCEVRGARLFRYRNNNAWREIDAEQINTYLHDLTGTAISAKDFRTWGGTLMAFMHLVDEDNVKKSPKVDKAVIEAVDQAAAVLGNTRTVAKSSYVHPHLLSTYGSKDFSKLYQQAKASKRVAGLDSSESSLFHFLELLFEREFTLLKNSGTETQRRLTA